jgi:hypothetical protein
VNSINSQCEVFYFHCTLLFYRLYRGHWCREAVEVYSVMNLPCSVVEGGCLCCL